MTAAVARAASAIAVAALLGLGCRDKAPASGPPQAGSADWKELHRARHPGRGPESLPSLPLAEAVWQVRLPNQVGQVLQYQAAPVEVGSRVVVLDNRVGRAAFMAADGKLAWHNPERLGDSVAIAVSDEVAAVFGLCLDLDTAPTASPWCSRTLGIDDGSLGQPSWLQWPAMDDAPTNESVIRIDGDALVFQRGTAYARSRVAGGPASATLAVAHASEAATGEIRVLALPKGGHVVVADDLVHVHDDGERELWSRRGRFARFVEQRGQRLFLFDLEGGLRPLALDAVSGARLAAGEPIAAIAVLSAHVYDDGAVALIARLDRSLENDALILYDRDLRAAASFRLPRPARPRVDTPSLGGTRAVFVVADGVLSRFERPE